MEVVIKAYQIHQVGKTAREISTALGMPVEDVEKIVKNFA